MIRVQPRPRVHVPDEYIRVRRPAPTREERRPRGERDRLDHRRVVAFHLLWRAASARIHIATAREDFAAWAPAQSTPRLCALEASRRHAAGRGHRGARSSHWNGPGVEPTETRCTGEAWYGLARSSWTVAGVRVGCS